MTKHKPKSNGVLTLDQVKDRIERAVAAEITCQDCGGYGSDHDRNDGFCNYCALYERVDDVVAKILDILTVNGAFGVRCNAGKHLISTNYCVACKSENLSKRKNTKEEM